MSTHPHTWLEHRSTTPPPLVQAHLSAGGALPCAVCHGRATRLHNCANSIGGVRAWLWLQSTALSGVLCWPAVPGAACFCAAAYKLGETKYPLTRLVMIGYLALLRSTARQLRSRAALVCSTSKQSPKSPLLFFLVGPVSLDHLPVALVCSTDEVVDLCHVVALQCEGDGGLVTLCSAVTGCSCLLAPAVAFACRSEAQG